VDELFDQLRARIPGLAVERLTVTHPADDDNVYFIGDERRSDHIQLDTGPGGEATFYIENGGRHQTADAREAADIIAKYLEQDRPPATTSSVRGARRNLQKPPF
jgi:hypothetical protein